MKANLQTRWAAALARPVIQHFFKTTKRNQTWWICISAIASGVFPYFRIKGVKYLTREHYVTRIFYYHAYIIHISITFDILPVLLVNVYMHTSEHGFDSLKL